PLLDLALLAVHEGEELAGRGTAVEARAVDLEARTDRVAGDAPQLAGARVEREHRDRVRRAVPGHDQDDGAAAQGEAVSSRPDVDVVHLADRKVLQLPAGQVVD